MSDLEDIEASQEKNPKPKANGNPYRPPQEKLRVVAKIKSMLMKADCPVNITAPTTSFTDELFEIRLLNYDWISIKAKGESTKPRVFTHCSNVRQIVLDVDPFAV